MPATEVFRVSRMRETRPSGLMRGEAAHAPPLLDRSIPICSRLTIKSHYTHSIQCSDQSLSGRWKEEPLLLRDRQEIVYL